MPTVILLDVSLSMCKPLPLSDTSEAYTVKSLAVYGLNHLIDYVSTNTKLEFMSLMLFSSLWERNIGFTRDLESIKAALNSLDTFYDKTNIINAFKGVQELVLEEWGSGVPCNVLLVTDGFPGMSAFAESESLKKSLFRFAFPAKLHIINICSPNAPFMNHSLAYFKRVLELTSPSIDTNIEEQLWVPESLSLRGVQKMFNRLAETNYAPYRGVLHCGSLSNPVLIYPPLESYCQINDYDTFDATPSQEIIIYGFMSVADLGSPPVHSRHLMFPLPWAKEDSFKFHSILTMGSSTHFDIGHSTQFDLEEALDGLFSEEGRQPSLCVLLHGSLKVEGMVAICKVGEPEWYGMLYSWADSKKKSNLMLSTFNCGPESVPWLGNIRLLGLPSISVECPTSEINKLGDGKSYSQSCVVWIKHADLNSDIQKVLRLAKKLPEKKSNFFRELNKFRRAALACGFYELIDGMAKILDRECTLLPETAHPEAALQLTHAANALRSKIDANSYQVSLSPLNTRFNI